MHDFYIFDQYSALHFASGVTAYFWGVGPWWWLFGHLAWEGFENSQPGRKFVNKIWPWPGRRKKFPSGSKIDTLANSVGDNISAQAGYWCAKWLDDYGKDHDWYGKPETK